MRTKCWHTLRLHLNLGIGKIQLAFFLILNLRCEGPLLPPERLGTSQIVKKTSVSFGFYSQENKCNIKEK